MSRNIGYIGLGNIGKPMCASLIKGIEGAQVQVYDVMPEPVQEMVELGGVAAESPRQIAEQCEQIGLCVRHDQDVEDLFYQKGMLQAARPGTIIAIHTTVSRDNAIRWAEDGKKLGLHILDAGITGGAHVAAEGKLSIMVGGDEQATKDAGFMFGPTSSIVEYCGPSGSGIVTKLSLNLMTFLSFTAASEGVALMKAAGLNSEHLYTVGKANGVLHPNAEMFITGREGVAAGCTPEQTAEIFAAPAGLGEKDLKHALDLAAQLGVELEATNTAHSIIGKTFLQLK